MSTHRRNASKALALLVGSLLAVPTGLAAQQGQHGHDQDPEAQGGGMMQRMQGMERPQHAMGMMGMMGMMGPGMSGMMGPGMSGMRMPGPAPQMILKHGEALELTAEQVEKLEALQERMAAARTEHLQAMREAHRELAAKASDPNLELDAFESALRSAANEHVSMQVAMARMGREARDLLTPEQREKLRVGMEFMRGAMMQMMHRRMGGMEAHGAPGSTPGEIPCPKMGQSAQRSP